MLTDTDLGKVRMARLTDMKYIVSLAKKNSFSLGFIPKLAYEAAITGVKPGKRWSNVSTEKIFCIVANKDLVGFSFVSFGHSYDPMRMGKIAQICLQTDARLMQRGRLLLDTVMDYGFKNKQTIRWQCGCADDLPSNIFWQTMEWKLVGDRGGIGHTNTWKQTSKRKVNIYRHDPHDMFLNQF